MAEERDLNDRQRAFVAAYLSNGGHATNAYMEAYGVDSVVAGVNATRLMKDQRVRDAIEAIRGPVAKKAGLTLARHLRNLAKLRDKAVMAKQYAAAVTAEVNRGKAAGLYVDRVRIEDVTKLSDDELEAIVRRGQMRIA